ncbi:hypothetical protein F4780DRAFT_294163 [Xylariomycetidae sp. FL0641]|nr:hypothetical protein F4780DRAFT_294163 [Xylariomycetidae sp. FL0641]
MEVRGDRMRVLAATMVILHCFAEFRSEQSRSHSKEHVTILQDILVSLERIRREVAYIQAGLLSANKPGRWKVPQSINSVGQSYCTYEQLHLHIRLCRYQPPSVRLPGLLGFRCPTSQDSYSHLVTLFSSSLQTVIN